MLRYLCLLAVLMMAVPPSATVPAVIHLTPDYATLSLENVQTPHQACDAWPIEPFRPRSFYLRGAVKDSAGRVLGRYFARGAINNRDGSHVAQYVVTLDGVGTLIYSVDSSPEVFPYEADTTIAFGIERGQSVHLEATPSLRPGCVWGHEWQIRISIGEPKQNEK